MKCDAPVEGNFDIEAERLREGLCRGLESEAFPWGGVVHEEDVLEVVVGAFIDVDFSGRVASEAAVDVLNGALPPGSVGIPANPAVKGFYGKSPIRPLVVRSGIRGAIDGVILSPAKSLSRDVGPVMDANDVC